MHSGQLWTLSPLVPNRIGQKKINIILVHLCPIEGVPPLQFQVQLFVKIVFCHNSKTYDLKYIKVTFLERVFHKESISFSIVRFLAKNFIFEKLPRSGFGSPPPHFVCLFVFKRKKYFWTKYLTV